MATGKSNEAKVVEALDEMVAASDLLEGACEKLLAALIPIHRTNLFEPRTLEIPARQAILDMAKLKSRLTFRSVPIREQVDAESK